MELVEFYRALLPAHGSYCLWFKGTKQHLWTDSIDELARLTLARATKAPDWYFATAAFDGAKSRKQDHVLAKRCFYLDLDAGPEKHAKDPDGTYPTNADAQLALRAFVKAVGFPPSLVVRSGTGLHVYYALTEDVTEDEWSNVARALGRAAKLHGLKADAACTTDSARVLRPIGSLHGNGSTVRLAARTAASYTLSQLREKLGAQEQDQFVLTPVSRRAKLNVNESLGLWEPTPTSGVRVANSCAALNEIARAGGDVPEPQWRAMIGIVKHTVEGLDLAQEWSSGHPDYDEAETAAKFDGWHGGPTTCETFGKYTSACDACEHKGKVKSPIVLGRLKETETAELPLPPKPEVPDELPFTGDGLPDTFKFQQIDGRWKVLGLKEIRTKDGEGDTVVTKKWIPLCEDVFWIDGWSEAGMEDGEGAAAVLHLYQNSNRQVRSWAMPSKVISSSLKLFEWLSEHQITRSEVEPTVSNLMHNYVNSQFNMAKLRRSQFAIRSRFGIQYETDRPGSDLIVAHGRYVIRKNGVIEEAVLGPKLVTRRNAFTISTLPPSVNGLWKPSVWKTHIQPGAAKQVEFYRKYYRKPGYEVAQLGLMLLLASPFMVFAGDTQYVPGSQLPQVGLALSLYSSSSGQGKTSLQRAAAAAYGDPSLLVLEGSTQSATRVFQAGLAAIHGTMPFFLDEVTQNSAADTAALINMIAQGNDKHRGSRDGDPRFTKTFSLIGSVSSNIPQRELLAATNAGTDALQMRLLELCCEFPDMEPSAHVEYERDRDLLLSPNYGCLGALLGLTIANKGADEFRSRVKAAFAEAARLIPGATQRERFFQRGMACVLVCHDTLRGIGVSIFDREVLIGEYIKAATLASDYATFVRKAPDDLLRKMVSDLSPHIVVTTGEGYPASKIEIVRNLSQLRAPYVGRRIEATGTLYLMSDAIREWAHKNQVSSMELIARAKKDGYVRPIANAVSGWMTKMTITRGTDLSTVAGTVYAIDEVKLFGEEILPMRPSLVQITGGKTA